MGTCTRPAGVRKFDIIYALAHTRCLHARVRPQPLAHDSAFLLGRSGNAITLSTRLFVRMKALTGLSETAGALENAKALKQVLDAATRWLRLYGESRRAEQDACKPAYIGAPGSIIRHVLASEFSIDSQGNRRVINKYFIFHDSHANYPRQSQELWIYSQMIR